MKKFLTVLFHILMYPLMLAAVLYFNWNIFFKQAKNYGVFVFVGVIVAVLMAIIYYICYAAITSKKKKKKKTIFNQTVRLCLVVAITCGGFWCACDIGLPDFLADATSSTVYYEDLADDWADRADVQEDLLNTFIELSVKAGTLPAGDMDEEDAIAYYQSKGINETLSLITDETEDYGSIAGLFAIQFQSIDAKGYASFTHPWIDCATSGRLTSPGLVHLLLDEREIAQWNITNYDYTKYNEVTDEDGNVKKEVTSVFFAIYDREKKEIVLKDVNWTVLDMLGTDTVIDMSSLYDNETVGAILTNKTVLDMAEPLVNNILKGLINIVGKEEIIGSDLNVIVELPKAINGKPLKAYDTVSPTGEKANTLNIILRPANSARGVLGYQEMAWLNSNGLLYAIVTLFSLRWVFLIFAAWGVLMNILIGASRGMIAEEKIKRQRFLTAGPKKKEKEEVPVPYYGQVK